MSDAFSNGASAVAYISVAGTATSSSYNFLRDFANAPQELRAFLDTFDVAQTTIEAFQTTLTQVRNVGLVVGHDAWKALKLATDVANEVNIFLTSLRDGGEADLTLWKKLEIAIKQKEILRYSEKLQNAIVHLLAVQQTICCGFQLKLLELSQANAAALIEVRDSAASTESVVELSTDVGEIREALSASISALGGDIQTSIHQAFSELKSQSATKADLVTLAKKLDQATLGLDSEVKALLDIEPITLRLLTADQDIAGLKEEASVVSNTIVAIASKLQSLGQGLTDVKSQIPTANEILQMLDRLETLAVDIAAAKSATVEKLWGIEEKLLQLARAMDSQEGISKGGAFSKAHKTLLISMTSSVTSNNTFDSTGSTVGGIDSRANTNSVEVVAKTRPEHDMCAIEGSPAWAMAGAEIQREENYVETMTNLKPEISSPYSPKIHNSYPITGLQSDSGVQGGSKSQYHTFEIPQLENTDDSEALWHASKEQIVPLGTLDEDVEAMNCGSSIAQEHHELSSNNRTSSTSSFPSVTSLGSIFSVLSASSMSSVASHHGLDIFARLFTEDTVLMPLCNEAVAIYGHKRFERKLRRMLSAFSHDLGDESESTSQKIVSQFIQLRTRRIAHIIGQSIPYAKPSKTFTLHENLYPDEVHFDEVPSDMSDSDDEFDIDLSEFERQAEYLVRSKSVQKLREDLRLFVYPNTEGATATDNTTATNPAADPTSDLSIAHSEIPSVSPSVIEPGIRDTAEAQDQLPSPINECDRALNIKIRFHTERWQQNIGLKKMNDFLSAITQPICQTYRIWLPAVIGGWLGYMLHEFRNGEQREEPLSGGDAA